MHISQQVTASWYSQENNSHKGKKRSLGKSLKEKQQMAGREQKAHSWVNTHVQTLTCTEEGSLGLNLSCDALGSSGGGVQTIPLVKQRLRYLQNVWNSPVSHIVHLPEQISVHTCGSQDSASLAHYLSFFFFFRSLMTNNHKCPHQVNVISKLWKSATKMQNKAAKGWLNSTRCSLRRLDAHVLVTMCVIWCGNGVFHMMMFLLFGLPRF